MLNDVITTPMRITRTQNKCNTIMTQLSKSIIDKSWEEYRGKKRRSRKVREHARDDGAYRSGHDKVSK